MDARVKHGHDSCEREHGVGIVGRGMKLFRTDDQKMFAESLRRFFADNYDLDTRRRAIATERGFDEAQWQALAELGAMAVAVPEAHVGLGGTPADTAIVMEAIGRSLFASPYLATLVLGATALAGASEELQAAHLPAIAKGKRRLALAFAEPQARYDLTDVVTTAKRDGDAYRINGRKSVVLYAGAADHLIVSARTAGGQREREGISLFIVPADAAGIEPRSYATIDGERAADLVFTDVAVDRAALIGAADHGLPPLERAIEHGIAALAAEAAGAMWFLHETTLAYLKTRQQFGATLGSFQALQHRMVDLYTACELAQSMAQTAALALAAPDPLERARRLSGIKLHLNKAARAVAQEAIQLHGGMGMTDELAVGHYAKRLTMIGLTFGDTAYHMGRYTALMRKAG
jgi:alkylation response protein AidB-like acyl-CoA dehydrogenase